MEITNRSTVRVTRQLLFSVAFVILELSRLFFGSTYIGDLLGNSVVSMLSDGLLAIALVILLFTAAFSRLTWKRLFLFLFGCVIFGLSMLKSHATNMLVGFLFFFFADAITDKNRFSRLIIGVFIGVILLSAALSLSGLMGSKITQRASNAAMRNSLGFNHPNHLGMMVFVVISVIFYIQSRHGQNGRLGKYFLCGILILATYMITNTFSFLAVAMLLMMTSFAYDVVHSTIKLPPKQAKRFIRIGLLFFIAIIGAAVVYFWKNPYLLKGAFKTLRMRFTLSQKYLKAYGIKPFGSHIALGENVALPGFKPGYSFLDSGYVRIFVESGFFVGVLLMFAIVRIIWNLIKHAQWQVLIIVLCMMVYFFNEQKMLTVSYNPFWMLLWEYLFIDNSPMARVRAYLYQRR